MCGIVGYVGYRKAAPVLLAGLRQLEYRGYDSYGIATVGNGLHVEKHVGKISERIPLGTLPGKWGIGHTRWATHGGVTEENAHPHTDCQHQIAVVHNGILTNYASLKRDLLSRGHHFSSETDTEVIAHLLEEQYRGDLLTAMRQVLPLLKGTYALLALAEDSDTLVAARLKSPLVIGFGDREWIAASDLTPLLEYTDQVVFLQDGDLATLTPTGCTIFSGTQPVERAVERISWQKEEAHKGGFAHFMQKEIFEQPAVFFQTLKSLDPDQLRTIFGGSRPIVVLACGTSYHAALVGRYLLEEYGGRAVRAELASEFKYHPTPDRGLALAITQSGETADTNAALEVARYRNMATAAITNVQGSSITRIANATLFIRAGPEMSVAATKSFIAQLAVFMEVANLFQDHTLDGVLGKGHLAIDRVLRGDYSDAIAVCAAARDLFYVGRGPFYPVAMEGALKMKEIAYIHAEAYAAGELKHGPFALLTNETPVIALCTDAPTREVMRANVKEIKARRAPVIAIGDKEDRELAEMVDVYIPLPCAHPFHQILQTTVVLQLLAYHTAAYLGCEIDRPRNLAKSVTVE